MAEFSLIIPTYNRREALAVTLQSLRGLRYARSAFEVLVIDDGSTDGTAELLREEHELPLRVLTQANGGAAAARNRGIREARGEFCLFVDDDVLPCPDLLWEHHELHKAEPRVLVRGPVINFPQLPAPSRPDRLWHHFSMNYLCTSNASLRRDLLLEAGLFDEAFPRWEDAELGVRLKRLGVKRRFTLRGYVFHWKPPLTPDQVLATARKDGQSAALLFQRYPSLRMRLRSGLHIGNFLRSGLLTLPPLERLYRSWIARGDQLGGLGLSILAEREYLRSGRKQLGQK